MKAIFRAIAKLGCLNAIQHSTTARQSHQADICVDGLASHRLAGMPCHPRLESHAILRGLIPLFDPEFGILRSILSCGHQRMALHGFDREDDA